MWDARPSRPAASPLRGRYLVRNRLWNAWLTANDALLEAFRGRGDDGAPHALDRVLVCVGGHLGDAIIATTALSNLSRAAPTAEIGVLSGSWNREVLESMPQVRWFHSVDHWKSSRTRANLAHRWLHYRQSHRRAVLELQRTRYDVAVDLYPYYPNFAPTLAAADIPVRIGYGTGGYGALYTREIAWQPGRPVTADHRALLENLLPALSWSDDGYHLGPVPAAVSEAMAARLSEHGLSPRRFAVLHAGGGMPQKDWPLEHWITVAGELARDGVPIVLTGAGPADAAKAHAIAHARPGVIDLCDALSWTEFRSVIAASTVVFTVDTVAMHVAAAEGTPCAAVIPGIDTPKRWVPASDTVRGFTNPVPCAPCYLSRGCPEMSCVRGVEPMALLTFARSFLPSPTE